MSIYEGQRSTLLRRCGILVFNAVIWSRGFICCAAGLKMWGHVEPLQSTMSLLLWLIVATPCATPLYVITYIYCTFGVR